MSDFQKIKKNLDKKYELREKIIAISRIIIYNSKKAIYEMHRGNNPKKLLLIAEMKIKEAKELFDNPIFLTGSFKAALEEYTEAKLFEEFVNKGKILSLSKINIPEETYLAAISDFTGELQRLIIKKGIEKDFTTIKTIWETIDYLFGEMQMFNFSNGDLRRKFDAIKYNLQKADQVMYDLSLKQEK